MEIILKDGVNKECVIIINNPRVISLQWNLDLKDL